MTATEIILARVRRTAFQPTPLLVPFGITGTQIHTLRDEKCCRCGEKAYRAEYRLNEGKAYHFCAVCR